MTRCFLGGCLGSGAHYQPWIHIDDLVGVVLFAAQRAEEGVVNVVAPQVLRNREWMETMRKVARRPYCPPVPEFMLRILGRTVGPDPEVLLSSQKVTSNATKRFGYAFSHPTFESAIIDLAKVQAR